MEFTKREEKMLKYIEKHGTRPHLFVISLIAVFLATLIGVSLGIKGIFDITDILSLMFASALFVFLCAIANFRVCTSIIQKYQKK